MDSTAALAEQSSRVDRIVAPRAFALETRQFTGKGEGVGLGGLTHRRIDDDGAGDERRERLARAYVLQRVETTYKSYCIQPKRRRRASRDHDVP